jgi:hypothetical protein
MWVIEENGEDWLQFEEIVFVVLVGTSLVTGHGTWDIVLVEPFVQTEHARQHSQE